MSVEQHADTERRQTDDGEAKVRGPRPSLHSLLLEAGVASEDDLRHAFEEGLQRGLRLGDLVLARGWLDEEGLARLLARQWSIPFLARESLGLDPAAATLLTTEQAQELRACAIGRSGEGPTVVVAEPTTERLAALNTLLGGSLRFAVVTEAALEGLLGQRARVGPAHATVADDDAPTGEEEAPHAPAATDLALNPQPDSVTPAGDDDLTDALVAELEQATVGLSAARERIEQLAGARRGAEQMVADLHDRLTHLDQERTREHERSRGIEAELAAERESNRAFRRRIAELLAEFED
jgi:MshEN domain